jgi:hypothetical protein
MRIYPQDEGGAVALLVERQVAAMEIDRLDKCLRVVTRVRYGPHAYAELEAGQHSVATVEKLCRPGVA